MVLYSYVMNIKLFLIHERNSHVFMKNFDHIRLLFPCKIKPSRRQVFVDSLSRYEHCYVPQNVFLLNINRFCPERDHG